MRNRLTIGIGIAGLLLLAVLHAVFDRQPGSKAAAGSYAPEISQSAAEEVRAAETGLEQIEITLALPPGLDVPRPDDCLIEPSRVVHVNSGVEGVIESHRADLRLKAGGKRQPQAAFPTLCASHAGSCGAAT